MAESHRFAMVNKTAPWERLRRPLDRYVVKSGLGIQGHFFRKSSAMKYMELLIPANRITTQRLETTMDETVLDVVYKFVSENWPGHPQSTVNFMKSMRLVQELDEANMLAIGADRVPDIDNDSDSGELIETLRHLLQQWEQRVVCPQCGQRYSDRACGPTHAVVMNLVRPNNADSGQALMSDLLQSELKPDLRGQVIHNDSDSRNDA